MRTVPAFNTLVLRKRPPRKEGFVFRLLWNAPQYTLTRQELELRLRGRQYVFESRSILRLQACLRPGWQIKLTSLRVFLIPPQDDGPALYLNEVLAPKQLTVYNSIRNTPGRYAAELCKQHRCAAETLRVYVFILNKKLREFGLKIVSDEGYRLQRFSEELR